MNAPEMLARLRTAADAGIVLRLKTATPLYTGGIGQHGDQVHPSNLLGGIRHMSCLLARTLGDASFEGTVWGNAGGGVKAAAKQISLRWDTSALTRIALPEKISVQRDGGRNSRWWFNEAHQGELALHLTRLGISDAHWQILTLALAIQLRHGTFGAKDQFGLGVLSPVGPLPALQPLDTAQAWPQPIPAEPGRLNLVRYAFCRIPIESAASRRDAPVGRRKSWNEQSLEIALRTRAALRNCLRAAPDAAMPEQDRLKKLRHMMFGSLNQFGSAVNVSAAYPVENGNEMRGHEVRLVIAIKPDRPEERNEVVRALQGAVAKLSEALDATGYRPGAPQWKFGSGKSAKENMAGWINELAGANQ